MELYEETIDGHPYYRVRVLGADGVVVLDPSERWSARHRTLAGWDDVMDRVWVYSGDVGTTTWTLEETDWIPRAWAGSGLLAPQWLRAASPRVFGAP